MLNVMEGMPALNRRNDVPEYENFEFTVKLNDAKEMSSAWNSLKLPSAHLHAEKLPI